jgi:hypothetical protein
MVKFSGYTTNPYDVLNVVNSNTGELVKSVPLISDKYNDDGKESVFHYFGRKTMNTQFSTSSNPFKSNPQEDSE